MQSLAEHFTTIRVLGEGGFGIVKLVKSRQDGQLFAVKLFKKTSNVAEAVRLAEKEIALVKTLVHPNIVGFHGMGDDQNERFIILEYCAGGDLRSMIDEAASRRKPIAHHRIQSIFCQMLLALHYCHHSYKGIRHTLLHRDLKPENVLLSGAGQVKLADFGLAKVMANGLTVTTSFVGTSGYLPPELVAGQPYDHKADIFNLGCILFELCTLRIPNHGLRGVQRAREFLLPAGHSAQMNSLVPMLLAIEPIRRPSTADLLASPTIAGWLQMPWFQQDDPERCQDSNRVLNDHMAGLTCHCTGVELIAREARLESKERALVEKRHELARRQDTIKSIEKALHARERMIQAREATLEAKIRRFNGRTSLSSEVISDTCLHPPTPPLKLRAKNPRKGL